MGEYSKASIVKYTRLSLKMSQEELAENICDPVTLSRYETGKINIPQEKFSRIMNKMGENGELISFPIKIENIELIKIQAQIEKHIEKLEWNEVRKLIIEIKEMYKKYLIYPEIKQYIKRIDTLIQYSNNEINIKEAISELENALAYTLKNQNISGKKILYETEILLLCNLATLNKINNHIDKALVIYENLITYFKCSIGISNYKPRYKVFLGYSNLLGKIGRYDDSIDICLKEIKILIKNDCLNYLYNYYYNIAWNLLKKKEEGDNSITDKKIKCYAWIAYQLCLLYPNHLYNLEAIKFFYDTIV